MLYTSKVRLRKEPGLGLCQSAVGPKAKIFGAEHLRSILLSSRPAFCSAGYNHPSRSFLSIRDLCYSWSAPRELPTTSGRLDKPKNIVISGTSRKARSLPLLRINKLHGPLRSEIFPKGRLQNHGRQMRVSNLKSMIHSERKIHHDRSGNPL